MFLTSVLQLHTGHHSGFSSLFVNLLHSSVETFLNVFYCLIVGWNDTYTLGNSFGCEGMITCKHNKIDPSTLAQWTEGHQSLRAHKAEVGGQKGHGICSMNRFLETQLLASRMTETKNVAPPSHLAMYTLWKALPCPCPEACSRTLIKMVLYFSKISWSWGSTCHWCHPSHVWGAESCW